MFSLFSTVFGSYTNYVLLASIPVGGFVLSRLNKEQVREKMFKTGCYVSGVCRKKVTGWDSVIEPGIIKQFDTMFSALYSFTQGMISDNENQTDIQKEMNALTNNIQQDLDAYNAHNPSQPPPFL